MYNYTWQDNQLKSATQTQAALPREVTLTTALAKILQNSTATLSQARVKETSGGRALQGEQRHDSQHPRDDICTLSRGLQTAAETVG
jgi:hypothetical protein